MLFQEFRPPYAQNDTVGRDRGERFGYGTETSDYIGPLVGTARVLVARVAPTGSAPGHREDRTVTAEEQRLDDERTGKRAAALAACKQGLCQPGDDHSAGHAYGENVDPKSFYSNVPSGQVKD